MEGRDDAIIDIKTKSLAFCFSKPIYSSIIQMTTSYEVVFQEGGLGLGLSDCIEVVELDEQGQAYAARCIRIGDRLRSINGVTVYSRVTFTWVTFTCIGFILWIHRFITYTSLS